MVFKLEAGAQSICLTFEHTPFSCEWRGSSGHYLLYPGTLRHADGIGFLVKTDVKLMLWSITDRPADR